MAYLRKYFENTALPDLWKNFMTFGAVVLVLVYLELLSMLNDCRSWMKVTVNQLTCPQILMR